MRTAVGRAWAARWAALSILTTGVVAAAGCSDEELQQVTQRVQQVQQAVEAVSPVTDGDISLGPNPAAKSEKCWARFVPATDERPGVLQLASYESPESESYPAVFFRAITPVKTVSELSGKSLPGELYIQVQKDGDVWSTSWEQPAEFSVRSAGEWSVTIEVKQLEVLSALEGTKTMLSGTLVGSLRRE